jgi:hypothetical protein
MEPVTREEIDRMSTEQRNEHAQAVIEAAGCHTFDWAYPIDWWRQFVKDTGFRSCNGEIVWGYGDTIFGGPIALTIRAKEALAQVTA